MVIWSTDRRERMKYINGMVYQFAVLGAIILLNILYFVYNGNISEFLAGALVGVMAIPKIEVEPKE